MKKIFTAIKSFIVKCKRVWLALKKPSKKEFEMIAKVSAVGILILGFISPIYEYMTSISFGM